MEKYDVKNHLFYDGYDLDNEKLSNLGFVKRLVEIINYSIFNDTGKVTLIPYFDGKVKEDGGISAIILGDNYHFTCHTFSYQNTVFVDYFGDDSKKEGVKKILINLFDTNNYDMGSKDIKGNFGKHIILRSDCISYENSIKMVKSILETINMTSINNLLVNKQDDLHFDLLQPIAESHISFHRTGENMVVDAFSCKNFDVQKLLEMFNNPEEYIEVNRGLQYKLKRR